MRGNHFALLAKLFIRCPTLTRADVHRFDHPWPIVFPMGIGVCRSTSLGIRNASCCNCSRQQVALSVRRFEPLKTGPQLREER